MKDFESCDVGSTPTTGTKICPKCGKPHNKKGNNYCHFCHNEYQKTYYKLNPRSIDESTKKRREIIRDIIKAIKSNPCTDCGNKYPYYVMDFDHLYNKKFNLSIAANKLMSVEKVMKEIDKCEIVCANCHRIRTFTRSE